jgi:hypothetical protein
VPKEVVSASVRVSGDKHQWLPFGEWRRLGGSINASSDEAFPTGTALIWLSGTIVVLGRNRDAGGDAYDTLGLATCVATGAEQKVS